jgi:hypothetical protein
MGLGLIRVVEPGWHLRLPLPVVMKIEMGLALLQVMKTHPPIYADHR